MSGGGTLATTGRIASVRVLAVPVAVLVLAAPASAASTVRVAHPVARACQSGLAGAGTARERVVAPVTGLVHARLRGAGGNWDVAVFGGGRAVAGSASFGARELAEGPVRRGQRLVVQACRVAGVGATARLDVSFTALDARPQEGPTSLVRVAASPRKLGALGLDLAESRGPGGIDVVLHGNRDAALLRASGLRSRTLIADLDAPRAGSRAAAGARLPSGRTSYRQYADYGTDMAALVAQRPDLVKPITVGQSLLGRPVDGLEISSDVGARDGKPVFLMLGVHHAREWPSGELSLEFATDLVHGYDSDPQVHRLLDAERVIVVPIVNPDGFVLSRTLVNEYKRKNCRVPSGACDDSANNDQGVDPNRNYGGLWGGSGSSDFPGSEIFRGAGPFSEPETQNVRALVGSRQVAVMLTNHTYGNDILRPPNVNGDPLTPDETALKALADKMASDTGYTSELGYQLYDTSGTTDDWTYFTAGAFSYTFEIGSSSDDFHPPYSSLEAKYPGLRTAWLDAMEAAADPGQHAQLAGTAQPGRVLRVHREVMTATRIGTTFPDVLDSTMVVPASGTFTWNVNPATWRLTCETTDGAVLQTRDVTVTRGQRLDVTPCPAIVSGGGPPAGQAGVPEPAPPGTIIDWGPHPTPSTTVSSRSPLAIRLATTSLRNARARGVAVRADCATRCTLTLSLRAGNRTVGRTVVKRLLGRRTIRVRLRSRNRKLTLVARAVGADGRATTVRRSLRLV